MPMGRQHSREARLPRANELLNLTASVSCRTGLPPARPAPVTGPAPPVLKVSGEVHALMHGAV